MGAEDIDPMCDKVEIAVDTVRGLGWTKSVRQNAIWFQVGPDRLEAQFHEHLPTLDWRANEPTSPEGGI